MKATRSAPVLAGVVLAAAAWLLAVPGAVHAQGAAPAGAWHVAHRIPSQGDTSRK